MANQRRGFRRSAPVRRTSWEGTLFGFTATTGASFAATAISEATLEANAPGTLIRIRGRLGFQVSAAAADNAQADITYGIIRVTASALAAGVVSLPTPGTDIGSDWILYGNVPMGIMDAGSIAIAGGDTGNLATQAIDIDGKAMRKFERNQAFAMVVENTVRSSTMTVEVFGTLRFLLKH